MKKTILRFVCLVLVLLTLTPGADASQWWDPLTVERKVYTYLTEELKLSSAAACGILANIEYESAFQVTIVGDEGTSFGLCQWHDGRYTALRGYCMARGLDYRTVEGQLAYLAYELKSTYIALYGALRSVDNTAEGAYRAAYLWCIQYERPADMERKALIRGSAAQYKYWNRYNSMMMASPVIREEPTQEDVVEQITNERPSDLMDPQPQPEQQREDGRRYAAPKPEPDRFPGYHAPVRYEPHSNGYTGFAAGLTFAVLGDGRKRGWKLPEPEEQEEIPEKPMFPLHQGMKYDMIKPNSRSV